MQLLRHGKQNSRETCLRSTNILIQSDLINGTNHMHCGKLGMLGADKLKFLSATFDERAKAGMATGQDRDKAMSSTRAEIGQTG